MAVKKRQKLGGIHSAVRRETAHGNNRKCENEQSRENECEETENRRASLERRGGVSSKSTIPVELISGSP